MRRISLLLALILPACGEAPDDGGGALTLGVPVQRHAAPPPGQSGATVTYESGHPLDWVTDDAATLDFEDQVLALVNQHRTSKGLVPLTSDAGLRRCARGHSRHMRPDSHDFVAHVNPEGQGPSERVALCEVRGIVAVGENAAGGPATPYNVFNAWMGSPTHRANIEEPTWRRTGVGYQPGPAGDSMGHYWTQLFAN